MHQPPIPHVEQTDPEIAELINSEARLAVREGPPDPVGELRVRGGA